MHDSPALLFQAGVPEGLEFFMRNCKVLFIAFIFRFFGLN